MIAQSDGNVEILESHADRIITREDVPCWECAAAPVEQVYSPIYRGVSVSNPEKVRERLIDAGWADVHVVGGVVCVLINQLCQNARCYHDAKNLHPLEKLSRSVDNLE